MRNFVKAVEPIYFPPKEIISATDNFTSLYKDYHISFEETYYDLALLLDKPLKKGANTSEQKEVLENFNKIINGSIIQKGKKFYMKVEGRGEFEMGLVSEGYRKLSTIIYLILSGSLNKNSILFWDEPETNMNPKMIESGIEFEFADFSTRTRTEKIIMKDLQDSIKSKLSWLNCHVLVENINTHRKDIYSACIM